MLLAKRKEVDIIIKIAILIFIFCTTFIGCTKNETQNNTTSNIDNITSKQVISYIDPDTLINSCENNLKKIIATGCSKESLEDLENLKEELSNAKFKEEDEVLYFQNLKDALSILIDYANTGNKTDSLHSIYDKLNSINITKKLSLVERDWFLLSISCLERYKMKDNIILTFGGDTSFGTYPQAEDDTKWENVVDNKPDYLNYPLKYCKPFFYTDDLTILNNETAISKQDEMVDKEWQIKSDPKYIPIYTNSGVEILNLANNHIMDCFESGYEDTKNYLTQNNLLFFNDGEALIKNIDGVEIVFLGYNMIEVEITDEFHDRIIKEIKDYKKDDNFVFVSLHWGYEYREEPVEYQVNFARDFIDAGASAIIGGHPHIMEGIETYKNKPIFYSISDFCFGGDPELLSRETALFRFYIDKSTKEMTYTIVPFFENSNGIEKGKNNFQPIPVYGDDAQSIIDYLLRVSAPLENGLIEIPIKDYF